MGKVNDRGTIKWTAMMMPEHIQMLNEYWETVEYKDKPLLDEQELNEINSKLQMAIQDDLSIEVKYYKDFDFQMVKGKLFKLDSINNVLIFQNTDRNKVKFSDIIDVTLL
ncbi:YolD-like family protein [Oceanobacillus massiliensis]|uniref:YolD-like family protein n=1 Tax=Oceanobacillus massiliensis TaxID=1465765 RepID=UPI00301728E9